MKIDKEIIESVLADYPNIDLKTRVEIIRKAEQEAKDSKGEPEPREPKEFMIIALTDDHTVEEIPMYIIQKPESVPHVDVVTRIKEATAEHNLTPKGQKSPVTKLADAMGDVKRKCLTSRDVSVKTKEPTIVTIAQNDFDFDNWDDNDISTKN